jgi:hypothetical protein
MKLPKLKYWYHATDCDTAQAIFDSGYLVPQAHRGNLTAGVFFANTMNNAAQWMMLRGITDYVIFKIPRSRFNPSKMYLGQADRMPKELNMICMRYMDIVKISAADAQRCQSPRFEMPGVKIISDGTRRLAMEIVDLQAFEAYIEANPELKAMIEKEYQSQKEAVE